jgi:hypothetical protein
MRDHAKLLNQQGQHALVLDWLTPRREKELCTQRTGQRHGVRPGAGVHVGGDAAARDASRAALQGFLKSMAAQ